MLAFETGRNTSGDPKFETGTVLFNDETFPGAIEEYVLDDWLTVWLDLEELLYVDFLFPY